MRAPARLSLLALGVALGAIAPDGAAAQTRTIGAPPAGGALVIDEGIRITGDIPVRYTLSPADFATMPRASVVIDDHGTRARFEGVTLAHLLLRSGIALGDSLRGRALATSLVIEARDGYQVVLAIAEVDASFSGRTVILADRRDGAPLAERDGPYRLIVEGDRRGGRNVRQVSGIRVVRARPY
jgi:hypothetical protein